MGRLYPEEKCIPVFSSNFMRYGQDERTLGGCCARMCRATLEVLRIGEQTSAWCYARTHKGEKEIRNSKCEMRKGNAKMRISRFVGR